MEWQDCKRGECYEDVCAKAKRTGKDCYLPAFGARSLASVRFLFDGSRINEHQTPSDLEMEDGDVIDVVR